MTDIAHAPASAGPISVRDAAKARLAARYRAEARFKWLGAGAVALAALFLVVLLSTVVSQAWPAWRQNYVRLDLDLSAAKVDPANLAGANYDAVVQDALYARFPGVSGRQERRALRGILSTGAGALLKRDAAEGDVALGGTVPYDVLLDDVADLYLKGLVAGDGGRQTLPGNTIAAVAAGGATIAFADDTIKLAASNAGATADANGAFMLGADDSSLLLEMGGGTVKLEQIGPGNTGRGTVIEALAKPYDQRAVLHTVSQPEATRQIDDRTIATLDTLTEAGRIVPAFNTQFLFGSASREPEVAGVLGAVVGSFLTLVVTLSIAFPIGVAAAIYLEEFAAKNRLTTFIEVNINNLAAVPSIVYGLLGLAVFLNFFGMPRSAPVVGGIVLALMTLPIIIIASRAALRAVPPSIREGAYGVGASKVQAVFHHVLPLAMPGIMTGTILGMAHALGETAPLLMIGMVAFIVDVPHGFADPATILPVQIYMWADFPEAGFTQKTSAAILVLLLFLVAMNAVAVILRKRFERRW